MIECPWKAADLDMVFDPDAGNHADKAGVFAATHRPLPGERQIAEAPPEFVEDACRDAYEAVRRDPGHQWPVVIPVLGEPGTGKSHLVRWVWNEFIRIPDDSFAVVYVPRARLNIGGVMESLLSAAIEDPDSEVRSTAEELVAAARATSQERDPDRVARELRAEVVFQLKGAGARRTEASAGEPIPSKKLENMLNALEAILTEGQEFEAYLHSDASAVGRRVAVLVAGRSEGALHEAPAGFTADELRSYSQLVPGQTRAFQQAVQRLLVKEEWGSVELAASILNDALDRAVSELIAKGTRSGGLTFTEVFRKLRESLYRADRELVLFIEELKLLGGLERELLEAFLDNRAATGLEPICRIRALIACTTGEWRRLAQDIGTLTSRLDAWRAPQYSLDVSSGSEREDIETRLSDMAVHYLNAARVGVSDLEESFRTTSDTAQWVVPNACSGCEYRKKCHATFGAVGSGRGSIGLFPFTEAALVRSQEAAQQQQLHTVLEDGFNPRVLLTGVLAPVLKHISLDPESFPNIPLARELGYLPASEASIRQALVTAGLDDEEAARAAVLMEAWGDSAVTPDGSLVEWSLDPRIPEGFGASPPPTVATRPATIVSPRERAPRDGVESSGGLHEAIERWRNGGPLDSTPRRNLRNRVNALIMRRVDWNSLVGVSPKLNDPRNDEVLREAGLEDPEKLIQFEETADSPPPETEALTFSFARTDDDYGFLAAAVEVVAGGGTLQADELVTLAEGLAERARAVESWVHDRGIGLGRGFECDSPGLIALAVTTLAQGLDPGTTDAADAPAVLNGMVAEAESFPAAVGNAAETRDFVAVVNNGVRVPRDDVILRNLTDNVVRADVRRWLLRRIGLRLSAAPSEREQPQMIDAGAIYASVKQSSERTSLGDFSLRVAKPSAGESSAMAQLAKATLDKLQAALGVEAERSKKVIAEVAPLLDLKPSASFEEFEEKVSAAVSSAESAAALVVAEGKIPTGDLPGNFHKRLTAFSELRTKISEPEALEALLTLARSSPRTITRPTAARFLGVFGNVVLYRELAYLALTTAGTYLEYLPNYVRAQHQTTSDPILTEFDSQYQQELAVIATLVERVGALGTVKVES